MIRTKYRKIATKMWLDRRFAALSNSGPSAKYLWQYLISGPFTTNIPGVVIAGRAGMAESLGWPLRGIGSEASEVLAEGLGEALREGLSKGIDKGFKEVLDKAITKGCFSLKQKQTLLGVFRGFDDVLREIEEEAMAVSDFSNQLIWLPNSIVYNKPESPNVVKSWSYDWERVPECDLQVAIYRRMRSYFEDIGGGWYEAFLDTISAPTDSSLSLYDKVYGKTTGKAFAKAFSKAMGKGLVIVLALRDVDSSPKRKTKRDVIDVKDVGGEKGKGEGTPRKTGRTPDTDQPATTDPPDDQPASNGEPANGEPAEVHPDVGVQTELEVELEEQSIDEPGSGVFASSDDDTPLPSSADLDADEGLVGESKPVTDGESEETPVEDRAPAGAGTATVTDGGAEDNAEDETKTVDVSSTADLPPLEEIMLPDKVDVYVHKIFIESSLRDWALSWCRRYLIHFKSIKAFSKAFPAEDSGVNWDRILWTSAEVIEQCVRLDNFTTIDVQNVLEFAMNDNFWITVGFYPSSLRDYRDKKTKETRFLKIFKKMQGQQVAKQTDGKGFSEE